MLRTWARALQQWCLSFCVFCDQRKRERVIAGTHVLPEYLMIWVVSAIQWHVSGIHRSLRSPSMALIY